MLKAFFHERKEGRHGVQREKMRESVHKNAERPAGRDTKYMFYVSAGEKKWQCVERRMAANTTQPERRVLRFMPAVMLYETGAGNAQEKWGTGHTQVQKWCPRRMAMPIEIYIVEMYEMRPGMRESAGTLGGKREWGIKGPHCTHSESFPRKITKYQACHGKCQCDITGSV